MRVHGSGMFKLIVQLIYEFMVLGLLLHGLIRHRAARHQWSVSNALIRFSNPGIWESLNCFKGPQGPGPDLLNFAHDFFAGMFLLFFFESIFLT